MTGQRTLSQRLSWTGWVVLANGLVFALVGLAYLKWVSIPDQTTALYVTILYTGQFGTLALLAGSPLLLVALIAGQRLLTVLTCLYTTALVSLLMLDTAVYAQYRFHLSGFVLEMAMQASSEVFRFSWQTWLRATVYILAALMLEVAIAGLLWRQLWRQQWQARWLVTGYGLVLLCLLLAHGWHAWGDANYDERITAVDRHLPLYYGATAKRFLHDHGLLAPEQTRAQSQSRQLGNFRQVTSTDNIHYPAGPLSCDPPEAPYNILIIAADSLRADMLDQRWMPALTRFANRALTFVNHRSNGNATKPGIFSLFYGLPASYWDAFTATRTPPLLIRRVQQLGYQTRILSSTTLISPAFDRNVFSSIPDLRLHTPADTPWQRDARITRDWLAFLDGRDNRPFFGFLFYDSPHSFSPPPDYPRIEPYWDPVDVLELDNDFDPEPYFNVYKTTVRYTDELIGKVLHDLERRNLLATTIVLVTSDHGKEFNENGNNYWGHGSNFSDYQLRVPLVIHWPGMTPARIHKKTVHFDIAPSLLKHALGCEDTPPESIASDFGLFTDRSKNWTIAHSYMSHALILEDAMVVTGPTGHVDVLDPHLKPKASFTATAGLVSDVLHELSRFNTN